MEEITTPLAKEVLEVLDNALGDSRLSNKEALELSKYNDELALKVQELELENIRITEALQRIAKLTVKELIDKLEY